MISAALGELEMAFINRLLGDATLMALTRLSHGWPSRLHEKPLRENMPLVTYQSTTWLPLSSIEPPRLEIQSDIWCWPDPATDGIAQMNQIDNRMLALFMDAESARTWYDAAQGIYVSSHCASSSNPQEMRLLRRLRLWHLAEA